MSENPTNSTLDVKLDYIQRDLNVIKSDVKEMKGDYISRREFGDKTKELEEKILTRLEINEEKLKEVFRMVYWVIGTVCLAVLGAIMRLVIK